MNERFVSNEVRSIVVRRWITSLRAVVSVVIGSCIIVVLVGCMPFGTLISNQEYYGGIDSLLLQVPTPNILDTMAEVGSSLGYKVSGLNRQHGTIHLTSCSPMFTNIMIGKFSSTTLSITVMENGTKLDIRVQTIGNFGTAEQENVMGRVNKFKVKLLEKIGQQ